MPCVLPAFFIGWFSTSAMEFRVCFTYTDTRDTDVDEPRKNLRGTAPAPQNIHPIRSNRSVMVRLEFYHSPANSLAILP